MFLANVDIKQMTAHELRRTYKKIEEVLPQLVGQLYPPILLDEAETIAAELKSRGESVHE